MSLHAVIQRTQQTFIRHWKTPPSITVQAPGRVNLIGEHTDYNEGFVLPCALNFYTVISGTKRHDNQVRVIAADYQDQQDLFSLSEPILPHPTLLWCNYVRGVVKYLQLRDPHFAGADLVISGNVPQGAGLSSSASLEMAVGQFFQALYQLPLDSVTLALNSQEAENKFVGCHCGIMDQLISALGEEGHALLIDCRSLETLPVAISPKIAVVIINSNVKRGLVESEYNTRRQQCEAAAKFFGVKALRDVTLDQFNAQRGLDSIIARRARHVISENQRTLAAAQALAVHDLTKIGQLMAQSHASMRDDFEITVKPIDTLVDIVKAIIGEQGGVRMTGGGFGGCIVALTPQDKVSEIHHAVRSQYPSKTGLMATFYLCHPAQGASVCQISMR